MTNPMTGANLPFGVRIIPATGFVVFEEPIRFETAEARAGFLENWAGARENTGLPPLAEGTHYQLEGPA